MKIWREQHQAQENLVKGICDVLKEQLGWGSGHGISNPVQYRLGKLTSENDVEAFLHAFEAMAIAASWPCTQWVTILGPYLTGPAQVVLKTLPTQDLGDYDCVRMPILDRYEVIPKTQKQRFQALQYRIGDQPKTL